MFENDSDCVVIQVGLSSVDSPKGLIAYMNVFIRCNALTNKYRLTKVSGRLLSRLHMLLVQQSWYAGYFSGNDCDSHTLFILYIEPSVTSVRLSTVNPSTPAAGGGVLERPAGRWLCLLCASTPLDPCGQVWDILRTAP